MKNTIICLGIITCAALFADDLIAGDKSGVKKPPPGFQMLFNGKDLTGWQGDIPLPKRMKLSEDELKALQAATDKRVLPNWTVENGVLKYAGKGGSLATATNFRNFALMLDWKIMENGDSGIYLRGNPQVQIWDPSKHGGEGSGGLYNNRKNPRKPLVTADKPIGEWNTFHIIMKGDRVTVFLNGKKVVDNTPLENYWQRGKPLPESGPIMLQHHGNPLYFRNIFIKILPD